MGLGGFFLRIAAHPKVVHRLPGRLRIHVNALKHVPGDFHGLDALVPRLCGRLRGVREASLNFETGNVLIHFDPEMVDEETIVRFLERLVLFIWKHRDALASLAESPGGEELESLESELDRKLVEWDMA